MNVGYVHTFETAANTPGTGTLSINVMDAFTSAPIQNARIEINYMGDPENTLYTLVTGENGMATIEGLQTPPLEYSMEPGEEQPFSEFLLTITADNYDTVVISGTDVFTGEVSEQEVYMTRLVNTTPETESNDNIYIPFNTLFGVFPPKIPESEIKPMGQPGEIVLSRVVIPETIIVHDGVPTDSTATNYYVSYRDYIKNVASSEIYSTWPVEAIKANVLAIQSFTLNRVYTEWYRNQGYNFTITSSTAYDHKWVHGRNYFRSIEQVVDDLFENYLSRPNVKQPILTQYCDGKRVSCPNWMSQWGSKYLADQNYSAIEILRYYYGDNMYINYAEQISGIPASWPGSNLDIGSSGQKVRQIQEQLNLIGEFYNSIPKLVTDGIYGENTARAVRAFQKIFNMPQSGIVDYPTWYKISDKYVRLSGIAELV
ncbi:MAG: peptidoglycan-binding protein [Lachnospira sp.]